MGQPVPGRTFGLAASCSPGECWTHEAACHGHHQTGGEHPQHAGQQQRPAPQFVLHHQVLLGAAILVLGGAAAEDVQGVITVRAVEARVPLARAVNVAGAIL